MAILISSKIQCTIKQLYVVAVILVTFWLFFFLLLHSAPFLSCLAKLVRCGCVTSRSMHVCWQVMHLEDYEDGATFSNLSHGPYPLFISLILLVLDSIFYLLVAVYLDQVIPGMLMREIELNCANVMNSQSTEPSCWNLWWSWVAFLNSWVLSSCPLGSAVLACSVWLDSSWGERRWCCSLQVKFKQWLGILLAEISYILWKLGYGRKEY